MRARRLLRQLHSSVLGASIRIAKRFDPHLCTPLPPPPGVGRGVRRERASAPRGLHKRVQSEWAGIRNCLRKARLHLWGSRSEDLSNCASLSNQPRQRRQRAGKLRGIVSLFITSFRCHQALANFTSLRTRRAGGNEGAAFVTKNFCSAARFQTGGGLCVWGCFLLNH